MTAKNSQVTWHDGRVTPEDRRRLFRQRPVTIGLTGLSASGKSTLAYEVLLTVFSSSICYRLLSFMLKEIKVREEEREHEIEKIARMVETDPAFAKVRGVSADVDAVAGDATG